MDDFDLVKLTDLILGFKDYDEKSENLHAKISPDANQRQQRATSAAKNSVARFF